MSLRVSEPEEVACGHMHQVLEVHSEVFCMGSAFTCTRSACFAVAIIVAGAEGVVVLKGDVDSGIVGIVLESYWLCTSSCCFHMLPYIWKTFDVPFLV